MHELPAGRMAEHTIAPPRRDALRLQRSEQPFVDAIGPLCARVRRAGLVAQIAEMVPKVFGKRCLRNSMEIARMPASSTSFDQ